METQVMEFGLKADDVFDRRKWKNEVKRAAPATFVNGEKPGFKEEKDSLLQPY